jgi:hypothetical protein
MNIIGLSILVLFGFYFVELQQLFFYDVFDSPDYNLFTHMIISIHMWIGAQVLWNKTYHSNSNWISIGSKGALWSVLLWVLKNTHLISFYYGRNPEIFFQRYVNLFILFEIVKLVVIAYLVAYVFYIKYKPAIKIKNPEILDD